MWLPKIKSAVAALWYNRISPSCSKLARLEQLEELDLSGNRLRAVPTTILSCQRLHTLSAHSNCINAFPEVLQLPEIKVSLIHAGVLDTASFHLALVCKHVHISLHYTEHPHTHTSGSSCDPSQVSCGINLGKLKILTDNITQLWWQKMFHQSLFISVCLPPCSLLG